MKKSTETKLKQLLNNVPYVKEYYKNGKLKNPINGYYQSVTATASRSERRKAKRKSKLANNRADRTSIIVVESYDKNGVKIKQALIRTIQKIAPNVVKKGRKTIVQEARTLVHYALKSR